MKITERRLRMIIRNVIAESVRGPSSMDKLLQDIGAHETSSEYYRSADDDFDFENLENLEKSIIEYLRRRGYLDNYLDHTMYPATDYDHELVGNAIANMSSEDYNELVREFRLNP